MVELRLVGLGVWIIAISGRHARNKAGKSANRRGGKEGRQSVFHVMISDHFDHVPRSESSTKDLGASAPESKDRTVRAKGPNATG